MPEPTTSASNTFDDDDAAGLLLLSALVGAACLHPHAARPRIDPRRCGTACATRSLIRQPRLTLPRLCALPARAPRQEAERAHAVREPLHLLCPNRAPSRLQRRDQLLRYAQQRQSVEMPPRWPSAMQAILCTLAGWRALAAEWPEGGCHRILLCPAAAQGLAAPSQPCLSAH